MMNITDKIYSKIVVVESCWEWTDALDKDGYGSLGIMVNGKQNKMRASRVSFEEFKGPVTDGLYVLHKCNNRKCVNPEHLYLGDQKRNGIDAAANGALKGSKHHSCLLNESDVLKIRKMAAAGQYQDVLAKMFGVHNTTINAIVKRRIWKHI